MADSHDNARLPDSHPEQCEHPAAPERDAILFHAFNLFLEARRGNYVLDIEDSKEQSRLPFAFVGIWDDAENIAVSIPGTTLLGIAVKLRFALGYLVQSDTGERAFLDSDGTDLEPEEGLPWPGAMIASAIRDLERMAAIAADAARLEG